MWKCIQYDVFNCAIFIFGFCLKVSASVDDGKGSQFTKSFWSPDRSGMISSNLECSRPDFYVCEEPPETITPVESLKLCSYRNVFYTEQIFRWVAGRGCLLYTPDFLYVNGSNSLNLNSACLHGTLYAPCLELAKPDGTCGCFPYDPGFEEVTMAVLEAVLPSAHGRWERCFHAAQECCSKVMSDADVLLDERFCGATFDGWSCWESAATNTVVEQVCPEFAYTNDGPTCHHFSSKNCTESGYWDIQTDFSTCSISPRLIRRNRYYIWVLAASIIVCVPAIFVFLFYKRLRVTRVALHRNLLIAIVMKNLLVIVTRSEIYLDELINAGDTVMTTHAWPCRVLAVLERVSVNVVFVCMLVEGIYLHRLICAVFRKELNIKLLYGVGAIIAILPVISWATVMTLLDDHSCWLIYTVPNVQWILDAPRITILLANTVLLLDILRVLLTKMRNSESSNQLSTTKATLFLMPVFGVQFLLTAYRPASSSCTVEQAYYITVYAMEGLQGFIVAILYCYANKEVHNMVKQTYRKTEANIVSRVRRDSGYYRRSTLGPLSSNRRQTYSTALDNTPQSLDPKPESQTLREIPILNERFASILEPISEGGVANDGFVNSEVSESDSGYSPNVQENLDDTADVESKTSTGRTDETIECHEWIKCVSSPSSSIYDNSLNEYEIKYLEQKLPKKKTGPEVNVESVIGKKSKCKISNEIQPSDMANKENSDANFEIEDVELDEMDDDISFSDFMIPDHLGESMDATKMFEEMMKAAAARRGSRVSTKDSITLNATSLSPNRSDTDKIVFVDD